MAAKIFRINYKSDFILTLNSDAGWMTPFCIKFWTGAPSQAFFVGWDGTTYTHCAYDPSEPTKLLVQFDDHHLPIGDLKFQIAYHFTVADFPNDTEDEVINPANITTEIDGQEYQVMLDFTGETAPEVQFSLPAYANEAQRIANEQQRIANEEQRIADEQTRIANEALRISAEQTRQDNEAQRIRNEQTRINQEEARVREFATLKSQSQAATSDANDAATLANQKAQLAADKAALAQQKAEYAQQQGDYAKEQGDTALADHQRAEADHGIAADDHTQAGNDHTRAESDHGIAVDDHTQAGNDHTRAESDHTRAESDHAAVEVYVDSLGAFDISAYHATGGVLAKYADLTAALGTNGANIPDALRKGGMSIKFVQSSDNKYVQYFLTKDEWSASVGDWEKILDQIGKVSLYTGNPQWREYLFGVADIYGASGVYYNFDVPAGVYAFIEFMDANNIRLDYVGKGSGGSGALHYDGYKEIPEGFSYARWNCSVEASGQSTINKLSFYPTTEYFDSIETRFSENVSEINELQDKANGIDGLLLSEVGTDYTTAEYSESKFAILPIVIHKGETFEFKANATGTWSRIIINYNEQSGKRIFDSADRTDFIGNFVQYTATEEITILGLYYEGQGTASISVHRIVGISKVGQEVLATTLSEQSNLLFSASAILKRGKFYRGYEDTSSEYSYFTIKVKAGTTYYFGHIRFLYDGNNNQISGEVTNGSYTPSVDGIVYVTYFNEDTDWIFTEVSDFLGVTPFQWVYMSNKAFYNGIKENLYDKNNLLSFAKKVENAFYNGYEETSSVYDYYIINVVNGHDYKISAGIRFLAKENDSIIGFSNLTSSEYTYTATYTGPLYITFSKDAIGLYVYDSAAPSYSLLSPAILPSFNKNDVLFSKKWVSCGDSFTQGSFDGAPAGSYRFIDMPYAGKNKVYPFFIGRRCGMDIVNEAISGSTIAYVDGQRNEFSTPNGRYTQIPEDADYITLWFGINDSHQNVPIGTIEDNVNTTFYGAWNIVMAYLIEHHPNAKIGIIISNGCDTTAYPIATRAIAKKWGVSYLDINGDYKVPLMLRTNEKTDVSPTVLQAILERQSVVYPSNQHPNVDAHEYQSIFIENWLRSL